MAAKKAPPDKEGNRIWIELDKPINKEDAEKQCELVNNMFQRLQAEGIKGPKFFWSEHEVKYCLEFSENGGYLVLNDRGHWFNLDYMGRP